MYKSVVFVVFNRILHNNIDDDNDVGNNKTTDDDLSTSVLCTGKNVRRPI